MKISNNKKKFVLLCIPAVLLMGIAAYMIIACAQAEPGANCPGGKNVGDTLDFKYVPPPYMGVIKVCCYDGEGGVWISGRVDMMGQAEPDEYGEIPEDYAIFDPAISSCGDLQNLSLRGYCLEEAESGGYCVPYPLITVPADCIAAGGNWEWYFPAIKYYGGGFAEIVGARPLEPVEGDPDCFTIEVVMMHVYGTLKDE